MGQENMAAAYGIAFGIAFFGGLISWIPCIGFFSFLVIPFLAGLAAGYFTESTKKGMMAGGIGVFVGVLLGSLGVDIWYGSFYGDVFSVISFVFSLVFTLIGAAFGGAIGLGGGYLGAQSNIKKMHPAPSPPVPPQSGYAPPGQYPPPPGQQTQYPQQGYQQPGQYPPPPGQ